MHRRPPRGAQTPSRKPFLPAASDNPIWCLRALQDNKKVQSQSAVSMQLAGAVERHRMLALLSTVQYVSL